MDQDIEETREKFLNRDFDEKTFDIPAEVTIEYARLCGETASRFLDPADPDFQAPPTYIASLSGGRALPEDFPRFGIGMDAGKGVECFRPVRPGTTITGRTHLHDIYSKTGRSGRMVFAVSRIEFYDEEGNHLANSDSRMVMREKG
ncbi:MAG: MaoC family dehydratase N-terminal domain-containing protein [Pseudomonadales bacterium]|nr:MaoC family dehydratase N-terminal domain-containing protein [Pseudomonadales bacterium]